MFLSIQISRIPDFGKSGPILNVLILTLNLPVSNVSALSFPSKTCMLTHFIMSAMLGKVMVPSVCKVRQMCVITLNYNYNY